MAADLEREARRLASARTHALVTCHAQGCQALGGEHVEPRLPLPLQAAQGAELAPTKCSGYIAARSFSALRIPCCNRILGKDHDDRNCPRYGVRGQSTGRRAGDNDVRIERHQLARKWEHATRALRFHNGAPRSYSVLRHIQGRAARIAML